MTRTLMIAGAVLATASLLAPTALAERPDDRAGLLGVGRALAVTAAGAHPDDRAAPRGPGATDAAQSAPVRPDDRAGTRFPGSAPIVVADGSASRFDWSDAGIGAAGAFGVALLIFAAAHLVHRGGRHHAAA